jgi:hypothetical protein
MKDKDFRLHHPGRPVALGGALALPLILLVTLIGYAGRFGEWRATEFQLLNLDDEPADFVARFYDLGGTEVYSFTASIPARQTQYFQPEAAEPGLDPSFTGTLHVETDQQVVGAVMHFASTEIPGFNGNDVFQMGSDTVTDTEYYAAFVQHSDLPGGFNSQILISNLGPEETEARVRIISPDGDYGLNRVDVPVRGTVTVDLGDPTVLPTDTFSVGAASIQSQNDWPLWVEIVRANDTQWAIYTPSPAGSTLWHAPLIPAYQPGLLTPTVSIQNIGDTAGRAAVCATDSGQCQVVDLGAKWNTRIDVTSLDAESYIISSTMPVAAAVNIDGVSGSTAYAAGGAGQTGTHLAAPMLFSDYQGFSTTLCVYNSGTTTATVFVTFVGSQTTWVANRIAPNSIKRFGPLPGETHYSARVAADQPVMGLVEGIGSGVEDGYFIYWATPYGAPPLPPPTFLPLVLAE